MEMGENTVVRPVYVGSSLRKIASKQNGWELIRELRGGINARTLPKTINCRKYVSPTRQEKLVEIHIEYCITNGTNLLYYLRGWGSKLIESF